VSVGEAILVNITKERRCAIVTGSGWLPVSPYNVHNVHQVHHHVHPRTGATTPDFRHAKCWDLQTHRRRRVSVASVFCERSARALLGAAPHHQVTIGDGQPRRK
jgi:hypothetical protein